MKTIIAVLVISVYVVGAQKCDLRAELTALTDGDRAFSLKMKSCIEANPDLDTYKINYYRAKAEIMSRGVDETFDYNKCKSQQCDEAMLNVFLDVVREAYELGKKIIELGLKDCPAFSDMYAFVESIVEKCKEN